MTEVRGRVWRSGQAQDGFSFEDLSEYLADDDTLVWADVYAPDHAALAALADETRASTPPRVSSSARWLVSCR